METAPPTPPPPPTPQTSVPVQLQGPAQDLPSYKEYRTARSKPIWRFLLISNLALGAFLFAQAGKKGTHARHVHHHHPVPHGTERPKAAEEESSSHEAMGDAILQETEISPLVVQPPVVRPPVPAEEQRELFQWILDEKRKVKPENRVDKERIDEEKALLKKFIRSETLPYL
ncbi:hypothetical protein MLD38_006907 [Melastoma candidum]|uniref:Uncharacterized protein n=1 Tax=Melastoma candidum TaxID=119954 RepID=A0ACB9RPI8_9MYRT|nr:hypothetical protein MLD38_006907 [Melastoma candidum]